MNYLRERRTCIINGIQSTSPNSGFIVANKESVSAIPLFMESSNFRVLITKTACN